MDEAEVLSDRIGIITSGTLKCLGTQYKLKRIYGKGFKLVINLSNNEYIEDLKIFITGLFPNCSLKNINKSSLIYEVI